MKKYFRLVPLIATLSVLVDLDAVDSSGQALAGQAVSDAGRNKGSPSASPDAPSLYLGGGLFVKPRRGRLCVVVPQYSSRVVIRYLSHTNWTEIAILTMITVVRKDKQSALLHRKTF